MSFYKEAIKNIRIRLTPKFNIINFGGDAIYADGFRKIVKISDDKIILLCADKIIEINGELKIEQLEQNAISVVGKIKGVEINDL